MATYGKITGRFFEVVADTIADEDDLPDERAVSGAKIVFTPNTDLIKDPIALKTFAPRPVECSFDGSTGVLTDSAGHPYVMLLATDDPSTMPSAWTWKVSLSAPKTKTITWDINIPGGSEQDLSQIAPVLPSTGTPVLQGPPPLIEVSAVSLAEGSTATAEVTGGTGTPQSPYELVLGIPTGGGGGTAYDDTAITARVTTAEADITALESGKVDSSDPRLSDARTPTAHTHAAAQISDATTVGRDVLTASSATAARAAIGAGTSSLQLGVGPTTALAGNTPVVPPTRTVAGKALSSDVTLAKADVGLGNVDNTSDAAKPVSTATAAALVPKAGVRVWNGTAYVAATSEVELFIGSTDPGAAAVDNDVWIRTA